VCDFVVWYELTLHPLDEIQAHDVSSGVLSRKLVSTRVEITNLVRNGRDVTFQLYWRGGGGRVDIDCVFSDGPAKYIVRKNDYSPEYIEQYTAVRPPTASETFHCDVLHFTTIVGGFTSDQAVVS
jgi:hypothetical protein